MADKTGHQNLVWQFLVWLPKNLALAVNGLITRQERRPYAFLGFLLVCTFVGVIRTIFESLFFGHEAKNSFIISSVPIYISFGIIISFFISKISGTHWKRTTNTVAIGIFMGIFPPIIDLLITDTSGLRYFFYSYYFYWNFSELPWLLYSPKYLWPVGEAVALWSVVFFSTYYVWFKTKSIPKTLLMLGCAYATVIYQGAILFMLVTYLNVGEVTGKMDMNNYVRYRLQLLANNIMFWQTMTAVVFYMFMRPQFWGHFAKRFNHILPFLLIAALGAELAGGLEWKAIHIMTLLLLACLATILPNDYFDKVEDKVVGRSHRYIEREDLVAFNSFVFFGFLSLFFANDKAVLMMVPFFVVSILYNYPFYRGKKYFPLSLKVEGVWGGSAFLMGVLSHSTDGAIKFSMPLLITTFLVFGGWSLVSALKDLKDIRGDKRARNVTGYLYLIKKGLGLKTAHRIFSTVTIICFVVPVVYAAVKGLILGAAVLLVTGVVGVTWLTFNTKHRRWFELVLVLYNLYLLELILFLPAFK